VSQFRLRAAVSVIVGLTLVALLAGCAGDAGTDEGLSAGPEQSSGIPERVVFDLGRDFSFTANPNGPWRYGYTKGTNLAGSALTPVTATELTTSVGFWHPGPGSTGYYPYIAANLGPTIAHDPTGSWAVRPGEVALEASASGQFAAIEFTVPRTASYTIAADFAGIHKGLSTTDAHVLLNDESLFAATISGYGGDREFYPRQGSSPTANFRTIRALRTGDVLVFAIGFGPNRTHVNDTTGLILTIGTAA
jgi:hypothetical protein